MRVRFFNIQGFRGDYTYDLDNPLTIINSKQNGVGKTTLYDCLRFLCDPKSVDKEEQGFFLNLSEEEGLFSVEVNDCLYGFALRPNQPPVFYRSISGELEVGDTNFNTTAQDIGILIINGAILNIFSKELNLFSSSNAKTDYALVKEITTHQQTEEVLELMQQSVQINKANLSEMKIAKRSLDNQIEVMPYYTMIDQLEKLINNPFYEDIEQVLNTGKDYIRKLKSVSKLDFNSGIEMFEHLNYELYRLIPKYNISVSSSVLDNFEVLDSQVQLLKPAGGINFNTSLLEELDNLMGHLSTLVPTAGEFSFNTNILEELDKLVEATGNLHPVYNLNLNADIIAHLADSCISIGKLLTGVRREHYSNKKLIELRASVKSLKVSCPIREEVYLIDGNCCY